tara:strand:+ start:95 stop:364 length:270 start_codon:yes stop_codon:yes gene_type:complete
MEIKEAKEFIKGMVGEQVTIWYGTVRASFETQISIAGKLEKHPESDDYRIVINDGTYTYFKPTDIIMGGSYTDKTFKDGSKAVFQIEIK